MYEKDYILRMIEMFGELIRAIFGLITRKDFEQAGTKINEAYLSFLRKDAAFFHHIPRDKLTATLLTDHNYTNSHLEILAELLNAEAALQDARGNYAESLVLSEKALTLFTFADDNYRTYSRERLEKMEIIRNRISELRNHKPDSP